MVQWKFGNVMHRCDVWVVVVVVELEVLPV